MEPSPEEEELEEPDEIEDVEQEDVASQEIYVDPNCEIKTLISFKKEPFHLPSKLDLKDDLFNDGDLIYDVPLLAPWPFCGKTFFEVDHELREDARKLTKWEHPWLTYNSENR